MPPSGLRPTGTLRLFLFMISLSCLEFYNACGFMPLVEDQTAAFVEMGVGLRKSERTPTAAEITILISLGYCLFSICTFNSRYHRAELSDTCHLRKTCARLISIMQQSIHSPVAFTLFSFYLSNAVSLIFLPFTFKLLPLFSKILSCFSSLLNSSSRYLATFASDIFTSFPSNTASAI
jgi:hypothetical protein